MAVGEECSSKGGAKAIIERGTLNGTRDAITTPTTTTDALQAQQWTLDGTGNWTENDHTTGGTTDTESRTHSNVNEIATISGDTYGENVAATFVLDDNGNVLDDGVRTYKWDANNRLREVYRKSDNELIAEYTCSADNRRFQKPCSFERRATCSNRLRIADRGE